MNGLINLAWTVMCIAATALCLVTLITDRAEIGSRLRQGTRLLAETVPWLVTAILTRACRGRSPGRAHPATRAVRGWSQISDDEAREFEDIVSHLKPAVETAEPQQPAAGRGEA